MKIDINLKLALPISPTLTQARLRRATIIYCERSINSTSRHVFANDRDPPSLGLQCLPMAICGTKMEKQYMHWEAGQAADSVEPEVVVFQ